MTRRASIANLRSHLGDAIRRGDWVLAERFLERGKSLFIEASSTGDSEDLQDVRRMLAETYATLITEHTVSPELDAKSVSWMIKADVQTAALAETLLPASSRIGRAEDVLSARGQVLDALNRANSGRSSSDISASTGLAKETVSRVLAVLRSEGKARTLKAGRRRISYITESGRAEARGEVGRSGFERRMLRRFMKIDAVRTEPVNRVIGVSSTKNPRKRLGRMLKAPMNTPQVGLQLSRDVDRDDLTVANDHLPIRREMA